ncbi:hypothetical protein [Chromobacterium sp. IIBBL 290-4]|nr:hypothetical protein [Chromobacterium sp. IIBBL 290-4]
MQTSSPFHAARRATPTRSTRRPRFWLGLAIFLLGLLLLARQSLA